MLARRQFRTYAACLHSRSSARYVKRRRCTLRMEGLEDRAVPATFHVALSGNDLTGDGSIASPFRTVQAGINAATTTADGEDVVNVATGTYSAAGVDLGLSIPSSANLLNLQLLGGYDVGSNFTTRTPRTTIYVPQTPGDRNLQDVNVADPNVTIDGFNFVFDGNGVGGTGGIRQSGGVLSNTTGFVFNNNAIEVGLGRSVGQTGARSIGLGTTATDQTGLTITNNLIQADGGIGVFTDFGHGIFLNPDLVRTTDAIISGNTITGTTLANGILVDTTGHVNITGNTILRTGTGDVFGLALIGLRARAVAAPLDDVTISENTLDSAGRANSIAIHFADAGGTQPISGVLVEKNLIQNNTTGVLIGPGVGAQDNAISATINFNSFTGNTTALFRSTLGAGSTTIDATGNWWGHISGPTTAANPGGQGQAINDTTGIDFQPWLVYAPDSNPAVAGVQLPANITVAAQTANFTPTNNNYRRLVNVVDLLQDDQTVTLSGNFNWTEANAAAAWALGNDGVPSTADDFSLLVRPNLHGVTITAASLGSARIQGPGDLATANLEGFLVFDGGDNQNWTISNLEIFDLDLGLGFFDGAGGIDAFNNVKILNNHIRIPVDVPAVFPELEFNQNIGIHFSFGENQTIQGNQIDMPGNGVSDGLRLSLIVGIQSNTAGLDAYDGLLIDGNILRVLDAQSASPSRIVGIWENGHVHSNNITISNNQFLNLATGNNPALNLQRAFRVTSHSSATSTVTYSGNTVQGANIGFEWLAGSNFGVNEPVQLIENTITNSNTGVLIQSQGSAHLANNSITGSAGHGVHVLAGRLAAAEGNNISGGTGDGIRIEAVSTAEGAVFNNNLGSNTGLAINNLSALLVNAGGNWFGSNTAAGVLAEVSTNVDYSPWLDVATDTTTAAGFQGDFSVLHVSAASPEAGPFGPIQEGIDLATEGGTVIVEPGTYAENLVIDKSLALDGAGPTTILSAAGGVGITASSPALFVTVMDLAIDGADSAVEATDLDSFTLSNVDVSGSTTGGSFTDVVAVSVSRRAVTTSQSVAIGVSQFDIVGYGEFSLEGVETLSITTGLGDDTFNVPLPVDFNVEIDGGANSPVGDTLNVNPLALPRITFVNIENVTGTPPVSEVEGNLFIFGTAANNKIDVTIRSNIDVVVKQDGVESLVVPLADITGRIVIHGLGGNDTITVAASVPVGAEIQGGPGNDKITGGRGHDLLDGGLGNDTVNGGKGNDTLVGSTDLDVLAGQADSDTLIGPDVTAIWTITGTNAGRINDGQAKFNTMESLIGGANNDTFVVGASGSVKGRIDGGGGLNKLDYIKVSGQTIINLFLGTATRTGGISNIRDVDGGNGPSVLVGDAQDNVLRGFNGRDLLIGGGGTDMLVGGNGDDILIGGRSSHDSSNTALTALFNEWKSTASYTIRTERLLRERTGGVNGAYSLTTLTVFDDGVADILNGEGNLDFYFAKALVDVTDAGADEKVIDLL
jgi:Ca2+-binding RTX toxin-like protein